MNKCFITKLPSSVDNDNLPVLGQLRINWLKQSDLTDNDARVIHLQTNDSITVKVSGAHFTDNTLASNIGNTKTITAADGLVEMYLSNDTDAVLTIDNKYSLTVLSFVKNNKDYLKRSVYFDIEDIKYCTNLTTLAIPNTQVSGDISALSKLVNITYLHIDNTQVSGDISALSKLVNITSLYVNNDTKVSGSINALSNLTNLIEFKLANTQVSGDISIISNFTNLLIVNLINTQVSGNISALSNLTKITNIAINNTQVSGDISSLNKLVNLNSLYIGDTQVSGAIDSLASLTNLIVLGTRGISLTGDMSKVPSKVNMISQANRKISTNFTWTANGRQNATLLAMEGPIPFDTASMDNMLIAQATCTFKPGADLWTKIISVNGTRTSASDAAVATLQNMGVTITGVTKQS